MHTTESPNSVTTESRFTTPLKLTEEMAVSSILESTIGAATTKHNLDHSTTSQSVHCMSV